AEGWPTDELIARIAELVAAPGRHGTLLEAALLELATDQIVGLPGKYAIDESRQARRTVERLRIGSEDDLLAPLPADEPERPRPDGFCSEGVPPALHYVHRDDLGVTHRQHGHEGREGFVQHDADRMPIDSGQPGHRARLPVRKFLCALDPAQEVRRGGFRPGVEEPRERIDDILGCHLAP